MPPELISNAIWHKGVYDLVLSETIWRLLDAGETALDVGAHVGYVTSLMAARVGARGEVISFEPHPILFQELRTNVQLWAEIANTAEVRVVNIALSDRNCSAVLKTPPNWELNRGVATIVIGNHDVKRDEAYYPVTLKRLDDLLDEDVRLGLLKLDVEGHEINILSGALRLLGRGAIRDIIFEDVGDYPTPTMLLLENFGYSLFSLAKYFRGPRLRSADRNGVSPRDDPNYLATLEPSRAIQRMNRKGWFVLKGG